MIRSRSREETLVFEIYLWLMVSDAPEHHWESMPFTEDEQEFDREEALRETAPERLQEKIGQACVGAGMALDALTLKMTDGGMIATMAFARNHPLVAGTERRFLERIAELAPASYGVIYALDTDKEAPRGEFDVLKLANGRVVATKEMLVASKEEAGRRAR